MRAATGSPVGGRHDGPAWSPPAAGAGWAGPAGAVPVTVAVVSFAIRPVIDAELPEVGRLHHRSRTAAYAALLSADDLDAVPAEAMAQWWVERWSYERDTHRLAVAGPAGQIVGFSYTGPSETPGAVELYAIHVDPAHVGTGVGRALMAGAHADLAALGGGTARSVLWVLAGNGRARRFYERDGWTPDGAVRVEPVGAALVEQLRYTWTG